MKHPTDEEGAMICFEQQVDGLHAFSPLAGSPPHEI